MERHDEKLVVFYQFVPGLCTVTPVAFGLSRIPVLRFMALDLLGNTFWTLIFSLGGYGFGAAFASGVDGVRSWEWPAGAIAAVLSLAIWFVCRVLGARFAKT